MPPAAIPNKARTTQRTTGKQGSLLCRRRLTTVPPDSEHAERLLGMKEYTRSLWYGLNYLPSCEGSVIPRCIPAVLVACAINYLCVLDLIPLVNSTAGAEVRREILSHPYTFQLMGLVFGSMSLYRITISYGRYWEGVTMVKNVRAAPGLRDRTRPVIYESPYLGSDNA